MDKRSHAPKRLYTRIALAAALLTWLVILLGAYTRLADAGLGCPDWPGCYGQLTVPTTPPALAKALQQYPKATIIAAKAWPEMIHRYAVGLLGLLIVSLSAASFWIKRKNPNQLTAIPLALLAVLVFQSLLGMWTVTWKLHPLVVMGHLLGGFTLLSLLWWLMLSNGERLRTASPTSAHPLLAWAIIGTVLLSLQIVLGGWTSANYAALACPDFPTCHGQWLVGLPLDHTWAVLKSVGMNYEGGVFTASARAGIHMLHRYGALVVTTYIAVLVARLVRAPIARKLAVLIAGLLIVQVTLGILNVVWLLPMPIAVLHNGLAAVLLLGMITLIHRLNTQRY